jgi:hypothetical protein
MLTEVVHTASLGPLTVSGLNALEIQEMIAILGRSQSSCAGVFARLFSWFQIIHYSVRKAHPGITLQQLEPLTLEDVNELFSAVLRVTATTMDDATRRVVLAGIHEA